MVERHETDESYSIRGSIDRPALLTIRDIIENEEPLVAPSLDDYRYRQHHPTLAQVLRFPAHPPDDSFR